MNQKIASVFIMTLSLSLGFFLSGCGGEKTSHISATPSNQNIADLDETTKAALVERIQKFNPNVASKDIVIEQTPIPGLVWVMIGKNNPMILTDDGQYLLSGDIKSLSGAKPEVVLSQYQKNIEAEAKAYAATAFIDEPKENLVTFSPIGKKKGEVYVFTDVNCGYCRKFHQDVPALLQAGIEVNYFAGPFFSKKSEQLEQIWCSSNPQNAMTIIKNQQPLPPVEVTQACKDIVSRHIAIGTKLDIKGTPSVYTKTGLKLGGYVPAQALIKIFSGELN